MSPQRVRPVPRGRVLLAAVAVMLGLGGIVAMTDLLRHPLPSGGPATPELDAPGADPRDPTICEEVAPREGQRRAPLRPTAPQEVEDVTSNQLYDCPQTYDGRRVRYRGEVIGAVLERSGGAWVQLNDDVYAETLGPLPAHRDYRGGNAGIGVFIPHALAEQIEFVGGPQTRGDVLEVVGTFHRVGPTAEVAVIRSAAGEVAEPGEPFADPPLRDRQVAAAIIGALALGLTVAERVASRRR